MEYKETPKEVGFQLLNAFREYREWVYYLPNAEQVTVYIGSILTGSRLVNNYEYRTQLINDFENYKPIGGEMEAQGIYSMYITEWIIVKGICAWGYKKSTPNKDANQKITAKAAVDYCFYVFSREGVFESLIKSDKVVNSGNAISADIHPIINIINIESDNYSDNATNKSLGNKNIFNAPVYIRNNKKRCNMGEHDEVHMVDEIKNNILCVK